MLDNRSLQMATARMAFAGTLHDIGKLAERARIDAPIEVLESNKHLYCPTHPKSKRHTHIHAAYTGIAVDALEPWLPKLIGNDMFPFAGWREKDTDDSLINAASMHHNPNTLLQWIVATADRVASGFERSEFEAYNEAEERPNHYRARLLTLFEQIHQDASSEEQLAYRYPLKPLSVDATMPVAKDKAIPEKENQAKAEYRQLWDFLCEQIKRIPRSHRDNLTLWLDHFDSLCLAAMHSIPSATAGKTRPDVSLYDHGRATGALAAALWRYHYETDQVDDTHCKAMRYREDWDEQKLLLIQGDFFGIQSFIFAEGGQTSRKATKLLRGRSFYVNLLCECAALQVLDALSLPAASLITQAAGKFLIVAPNTEATLKHLQSLQGSFDQWFYDKAYARSGIGLCWQAASCNDFLHGDQENSPFKQLMARLFDQLETKKYQRFDLTTNNHPTVFKDYLEQFDATKGVCQVDGCSPATRAISEDDTIYVSDIAYDQMQIGSWLTKHQRLLIATKDADWHQQRHRLHVDLFGYTVCFIDDEEADGKFGEMAASNTLRRAIDFSLPDKVDSPLFSGYAKRFINTYVARFSAEDIMLASRYGADCEPATEGNIKSWEHLACDDRWPNNSDIDSWRGIKAISALKGDVDNLGLLFQAGLSQPTFAKMASLSRQMNFYFTVWLPYLCRDRFPDTYTVFAGGDDFFLMGPWRSQIRLAQALQQDFSRYVCRNPQITVSCGLYQTKAGLPISHISSAAEDALDNAKAYEDHQQQKNAVTVFNTTMSWPALAELNRFAERLKDLSREYKLSTAYVYQLLRFADMCSVEKSQPTKALWRSQLAYRTVRFLKEEAGTASDVAINELITELSQQILRHQRHLKVAVFQQLYAMRERT